MIKSINLQVNKFGAVEVTAQVEKKELHMMVMLDDNNEYSVSTSTGLSVSRVYGTWGFESKSEDKVLRCMFNQAHNLFEANKPEPATEE